MSLIKNIFIIICVFCSYYAHAETSLVDSITQKSDTPALASNYTQKYTNSETNIAHNTSGNTVEESFYSAEIAKALVDEINQEATKQKIKFEEVCKNKNTSSTRFCVEEFKDLQLQPMTAVGLAKEYASAKHNRTIICSPLVRTALKDDYLKCTSIDGTYFYEFHFDDVYETKHNTLYNDLRTGIGIIYDAHDTTDHITTVKGVSIKKDPAPCYQLTAPAERFGLKIDVENIQQPTFGSDAYCIMYNTQTASQENYLGKLVNTDVFKTMQTTLNFDLEALLAQYTARQLYKNSIIMDKFWCDYSSRQYGNDDILSCYVQIDATKKTYTTASGANYKMPTPFYSIDSNGEKIYYNRKPAVANIYKIDFRFDDLTESWDSYKEGTYSALQCISKTSGVYDGRHCAGITKEQCNQLAQKVEVKWSDANGGMCTLTAANTVANIQRVSDYAKTIGIGTGVIALSIVSGGSTLVVFVSTATASAALATSVASETLTDTERAEISIFTNKMAKCTNASCVREQLQWFLENGSQYIDNLTDAQIIAMDTAISEKLDNPKYFDKESDVLLYNAYINNVGDSFISKCFGSFEKGKFKSATGNSTVKTKCNLQVATLILDFIPITNMAKSGKKISGLVSKAANKMSKLSRTGSALTKRMETIAKDAKYLGQVEVSYKTVKGSRGLVDGFSRTYDFSTTAHDCITGQNGCL